MPRRLDVRMEYPLLGYLLVMTKFWTGTMSNSRRGTSEKGKSGKRARRKRRRNRLNPGDYRDRRCRHRRLHQLHRHMGDNAQRTICMVGGAVRVAVRSLDHARDRHQQHAKQRQEQPPRTAIALALVIPTHN